MRKILMSAAVGAIALAGAAQAQSYRAENRVVVTPTNGGAFSVPSSNTYGARGAWCAAADYAHDVLGAKGTNRIYVQQAKSSNSGPVVFGLTPGGASPVAVLGTSAALRTAGSNLSINHALQFCQDGRLRRDR